MMQSTLVQNPTRQGGMLQLGYSEPVVPPEMMPVNQNHMPQMQGGGTIPLSLLVEFVVHKTYHDITVMADLLPGKSDLERKIAVVQFATKYRQLFIRLFSLVKWASSVDKVVKCGDISSFLDHQAMLFVDTADKLYMMSNQLLIQARLPNFSIPTAVDVLTNGTYTRLPTCIRDRVIPPKAILPSEKRATLKRIEQIVLFRLVSEIIPPQIKDLTVERGIVHLTVPGKFRASLTLMGDSDSLPWRLIKLTFLVDDKEVGGGRTLVHELQVNYIHELVQSRLISNKAPFVDLFDILHSFSLSLQLEVLQAQADRLRVRWNKFVNVDEYLPGQKLLMSYWTLNPYTKNDKTRYSVVIQQSPKNSTKPLQVINLPKLPLDDIKLVEAASNINHLSLEQLIHQVMHVRSLHLLLQLKDMLKKHRKDDQSFIVRDSVDQPVILVIPLLGKGERSSLRVYVDLQTGILVPSLYDVEAIELEKMEKEINEKQTSLLTWINTLHSQLLRKCFEHAVQHLSVVYLDNIPLLEEHKDFTGDHQNRIFIRFNRHPYYYLVVHFSTIETDQQYSLLKTTNQPVNIAKPQSPKPLIVQSVVNLRQTVDIGGGSPIASHDDRSMVNELVQMILICESRIPFVSLLQGISADEYVLHQGMYEEEHLALVCKLNTMPRIQSANDHAYEMLTDSVLECSFRLHERVMLTWAVEITIKSLFPSCATSSGVNLVMFTYDENIGTNVMKSFTEDWTCVAQLYGPAYSYMLSQKTHLSLPNVHSYNYKSITFKYGYQSEFFVTINWSSQDKKFKLAFGCTHPNATSNGHCITQHYLTEDFNSDPDLAKLMFVLNDTSSPLQSLIRLPTTPLHGVNQKITIGEQLFTVTAQTATVIRLNFFSIYNLNIYLHSNQKVGVQDGAFSQFDYSKVKSGCVPIPGLCSFLARFQDPKDSRYKSDLEKDNPPSPNSALNSSQNKFGLMEVASGSWSGSQPSILSHAALHGLCSKLANIHPMQASKCSQIEQFFGSLIVKRHLEKCVRLVDIGAGSQSIVDGNEDSLTFIARSLQFVCQFHPQHMRLVLSVQRVVQENWTPEDLQTLEKYFDSRITCSPYRYNAVASFVNMIFAPAYILRDFMQVMQLELTGRVIAPGMQTNTKWNMNLCLTSPPRIPITLLGMPSILVRDKVLLFVQLTQAVPQNNAPNTIVVPLLHDRQSKSVQILPHAMNAQTQATRNLQHTATLLTRLDELRIQQPINDQNFLSVAVHYLMENLTFPNM